MPYWKSWHIPGFRVSFHRDPVGSSFQDGNALIHNQPLEINRKPWKSIEIHEFLYQKVNITFEARISLLKKLINKTCKFEVEGGQEMREKRGHSFGWRHPGSRGAPRAQGCSEQQVCAGSASIIFMPLCAKPRGPLFCAPQGWASLLWPT